MSSCLRASRTRCYSTVHLSLMVTKPALWGSGYTTTGVENSPAPPPTSCYVGRFGFRVLGGTHFTGHPEEHVKPQGRKSYMGPLLIAALLEGQEYHNAKGQHPRRLGLDSIVVSAPSLIKSLLCAVLLSTIGVTTFIPSLGSKSPNLTQLPTNVNETPIRITTTTNIDLIAKPRSFLPVVFHLTVTVCMNAMMFLRGYFREVHRRLARPSPQMTRKCVPRCSWNFLK